MKEQIAVLKRDELFDFDPRKDWDNITEMYCWHPRYNLGDENPFDAPDDFLNWLDENKEEVLFIEKLYLYDHSGITIKTGGFGAYGADGWDWGQVGWILVTKEDLKKAGFNLGGYEAIRKARELLEFEAKEYASYLEGDVWNVMVYDRDTETEGCTHTDSISGILGYEAAKELAEQEFPEARLFDENEVKIIPSAWKMRIKER